MDYNINYYQELGIDKNANDDDIKKAYRKLAHQYHPDKNQNNKDSEKKFQRINEANSILSDNKSKQEYDQRSPHGKSYSPNNFGKSSFEFNFNGGDIFSQFFGENGPFGGFNPFGFPFQTDEFKESLDINANINVNLKQIYLNENLNIKFKRFMHCENCSGTGFDKNSHSEICEVCDGIGKDSFGNICKHCNGEGKIYIGQCQTCKGEKVLLKDSEINIQNILKLRHNIKNAYRGYGHQSKYYRNKVGNLILNIIVDRKDKFEIVNGFELHHNINIHFQDAIDGSEVIFKHIDDSNLKIKLPTKTKNGDIIRVKDKGLIKSNDVRDDLYLKINIIIDYDRI